MPNDHVTQLGYVGFEVSDLGAWRRFATEVLGLAVAGSDAEGSVQLRMDENDHRFTFREGPADDIAYAGWQVEDAAAMGAVGERLRRLGAPVREGSTTEAELRSVAGLLHTRDPDGVAHEVHWGPRVAPDGFRSPRPLGPFVAGDQGLGHIVLNVADADASLRFFRDGLGLRTSDYIELDTGGPAPVSIAFLHCGPRHHSLALTPFPPGTHLHHLMLQVRDPDDVGMTFDLCQDRGVPISSTLGRHTNDRMTSFYAVTPSGFQVEFGHGGIEVDDTTWEVRTHTAASTWGHRSPAAASH